MFEIEVKQKYFAHKAYQKYLKDIQHDHNAKPKGGRIMDLKVPEFRWYVNVNTCICVHRFQYQKTSKI